MKKMMMYSVLVCSLVMSVASSNNVMRQSRQQQPSLSLNLPAPFPSVVLLPRIPIPPVMPQQAQVLGILSTAVAQIGQALNAPLIVRPAGSPPILPSGVSTSLIPNVPGSTRPVVAQTVPKPPPPTRGQVVPVATKPPVPGQPTVQLLPPGSTAVPARVVQRRIIPYFGP